MRTAWIALAAMLTGLFAGSHRIRTAQPGGQRDLVLRNASGSPVIRLGSDADGGIIELFDHSGSCQVTLACTNDGGLVEICNRDGDVVGCLVVRPDGPALQLWDPTAGGIVAQVRGMAAGGAIGVYDGKGTMRVGVDAHAPGQASLVVYDELGGVIATLPTPRRDSKNEANE